MRNRATVGVMGRDIFHVKNGAHKRAYVDNGFPTDIFFMQVFQIYWHV